MLRILFRVTMILAIGAYFSVPSAESVDEKVQEVLQETIADGALDDISDPAQILLLAACKANANACSQLARSAIRVRYENKTLYANVALDGFGRHVNCYAAFTRLICPGGFAKN